MSRFVIFLFAGVLVTAGCSDTPSGDAYDAAAGLVDGASWPDGYAICGTDAPPIPDGGLSPDALATPDASPGGRLTQCPDGEGCYVNVFGMSSSCEPPRCDVENTCGHGEQCGFINACHAGSACATLNTAEDGLLCAKLCDASFAAGITTADLPLSPDPLQNGVAPWACGRDADGPGTTDTPLAYPRHVCVPLGGDGPIRYWDNLTSADGWPYGATIGVCVDTQEPRWNGNPYTSSTPMLASVTQSRGGYALPMRATQPPAAALSCNPSSIWGGCACGNKCGVIIQSEDPAAFITNVACVPEGPKRYGERCAFDGDIAGGNSGVSDCAVGLECDGVCRRVCDLNRADGCPVNTFCNRSGYHVGSNYGWCVPSCSAVGAAEQ